MTDPNALRDVGTGIHEIAAVDYYADKFGDTPMLSSSIAKILLDQSPLHAWHAHARLNPNFERKDEAKFDAGTVVHRMLLEPEAANRVAVVEASDWRTKAAKEARDEARAAGDTPMLVEDYARVAEMLAAVRDQINRLDVDPLPFYGGKAEQTIIWEDERTGVACKARLDWLHDGYHAVSDLKTTKWSANPLKWSQRTLWNIGAHIETWAYKQAVLATTGVEPELNFIVAETDPPYAVSVVSVAPSGLALAEAQWNAALDTWKTCLETDIWPAYTTHVVPAEVPPWLESQFWDQQALEGEISG